MSQVLNHDFVSCHC